MMSEIKDLIRDLKLDENTDDEKLQNARYLAIRHLKSGAPIPQTLMTVVQRGAMEIGEIDDERNLL